MVKENCEFHNYCKRKNLLYQAIVETEDKNYFYIGPAECFMKTRIDNNESSFKNCLKCNNTSLNRFIWKFEDINISSKMR